jgi:hypothetical protein
MTQSANKPLPLKDAAVAYEHFGEAIKHEIARYAVRIVGIKNAVPEDSGSGTCIKIGTRYLVLTAAHVILGYTADTLWIVAKAGAMNQRARPLRIGLRGGKTGEAIDVAYIELDEATVRQLQIEALPVARLHGRAIATDEFIALSGIPGETLTIKHRGPKADDVDLIWRPFTAITMQKDAATWHAGTDRSVELETDYPKEFAPLLPGGTPQKLPDAPGMSGGGYWLCNLPKRDEIWSGTRIELAGIITAWHRTEHYLIANRIANAIGLLSDDFSEWRLVVPRE